MNLGESLLNARKSKGLTQEAAAEKLGVSRQTVSKWETGETLPDIRQSKRLAALYGVTLDELIDFDAGVREIQEVIERTTEETSAKIDWTKMWSKQYPILVRYQEEVDIPRFEAELRRLLDQLEQTYGYGSLDAFLVLKDILGAMWKTRG
ncbi:MAG: helix-turn-helix transcriptional regulator [Oscillibacter sp.]|nr:helix-turn-helix transcriptional regulator [Oscillibacter sp.]